MATHAMTVACHQPNYMPWPGFFYKAYKSDLLVLLDNTQFPRGTSWVNRNRIKNANGALWLTVPVMKKGRGFQRIRNVEIDNERNWARKHFLSLVHAYSRAPYFADHFGFFEDLFGRTWRWLIDLNLEILNYLKGELAVQTEFRLASELDLEGKGTEFLVQICEKLGATAYLSISSGKKYLDESRFEQKGICVEYYNFTPLVYPQLWGSFIPNLSVIDLLLNCGEKSHEIMTRGNHKSL